MNELDKLKFYIDSLCIYNLKGNRVIKSLRALIENRKGENAVLSYSDFFSLLSPYDSLRHYISCLILNDDNVFSRAAAAKSENSLPPSVIDGVKSDLEKLEELSLFKAEMLLSDCSDSLKEIFNTLPKWETGTAALPLKENWKNQLSDLCSFYEKNGYGDWAKYCAFSWRNKEFSPISSIDTIRLDDLKNYERQRKQVVENTVSFLKGLPSNNILLYGDRGTGKSSTVHAVLNEFRDRGLRMIEISKGDISDLTLIREKIAQSPMKFIIFIDDLSFDSHDDSFGELKAALEGSLSGRRDNALIYATSNRRHLIKENFNDRQNDVHRSDTMQEELSLSDRFGLSITFMNPDKKEYLDITEKIAKGRDISFDTEKLLSGAENWARRRGGRSPRAAKQFIDYVEACEKQGIVWE